jgi:hypothetical protein
MATARGLGLWGFEGRAFGVARKSAGVVGVVGHVRRIMVAVPETHSLAANEVIYWIDLHFIRRDVPAVSRERVIVLHLNGPARGSVARSAR